MRFPVLKGRLTGVTQLSLFVLNRGGGSLLVSLGHTGRRVVLGHILNTLRHLITKKKSHSVLSKFTTLCWATFIAILGCVWPEGRRLDTPVKSKNVKSCVILVLSFLVQLQIRNRGPFLFFSSWSLCHRTRSEAVLTTPAFRCLK